MLYFILYLIYTLNSLKILTMFNMINIIKRSKLYSRKYLFSTGANFFKQASFPYKFGGLPQFQLSPMLSQRYYEGNEQFIKQIFGQNVLKDFAVAYRNIIKGLHQKDKQYVQSLLEKNLTKNIVFPETELLNPQAQIEVSVGKMKRIVYGCFDRSQLLPYNLKQIRIKEDQLLSTLIILRQKGSLVYKTSLYCFNIYFKSAMKLKEKEKQAQNQNLQNQQIQKKKARNNQKEIHMIQFQIQYRISFGFFMNGLKIILKNLFNLKQMQIQVGKLILGANRPDFKWKIGDIDKVLQGNFTQQIKQKAA